jgi:hypothetical protein
VETERAIYAHPKSRKKEIVQMRKQVDELRLKANGQE